MDAATAPRMFPDLRALTLWFSAVQPSGGPKPPCVLPAPPENPILATATFEVPKLVLPSRLVPTLPPFLATLSEDILADQIAVSAICLGF